VVRNRDGSRVDPVPYLVVTGLAFLGCFSFLPVYLRSLGVGLPASVAVAAAAFVGLAGVAYYRMVWTARPDLRGELPPGRRLQRLLYAALVVVGVLTALTLLLVWQ